MTDTKPMRIGRLSRRTGASVKALRFYDSQGLLLTAGRSAANYRLFPEDAVTCVNSVRTLKAAGLTIRDLRELGGVPCRRRSERLAETEIDAGPRAPQP